VYSFAALILLPPTFLPMREVDVPVTRDFCEVEKALGTIHSMSPSFSSLYLAQLQILSFSAPSTWSWLVQWRGGAATTGIVPNDGGAAKKALARTAEVEAGAARCWDDHHLHERFPTAVGKSEAWLLSSKKMRVLFFRLLCLSELSVCGSHRLICWSSWFWLWVVVHIRELCFVLCHGQSCLREQK
jgi:hypothetical protein